MTRDNDTMERAMLNDAMDGVKAIAEGRPCMVIIGFDIPGGMKVCSASNLSPDSQMEMLHILTEGYSQVPENTTLN